MKKARTMLLVIFLIGVVGGVLAFKAKNSFAVHTFYTLNDDGTSCNVTFLTRLTTTVAPFGFLQTTYYTTPVSTFQGACPTLRVIAAP